MAEPEPWPRHAVELRPYEDGDRWLLDALVDHHGRRILRLFQHDLPSPSECHAILLDDPAAATLVPEVDLDPPGPTTDPIPHHDVVGPTPLGIVSLFGLNLMTGSVWFEPTLLPEVPGPLCDLIVGRSVDYAFSHWPITCVRVREPDDQPSRLESLVSRAEHEGDLPDAVTVAPARRIGLVYRRLDRSG